ncbi:hypothetical protein [Phenylobacterium aquaticum]|uniref:hypothetical protein n=1 Tax=Phenylobacterium aquaticum TaxID=1763816 RepID=UPI001F5CDA48|nr:hypothetical protein [Phenylobacterium aquaticum]MCI3132701.1 hypothetical protein [Phenylobacterium aquaticum]
MQNGAGEDARLKTPFQKKSKRRLRLEARQRAKWWDQHGEAIRLTLIGGGIVFAAAAVAKFAVR